MIRCDQLTFEQNYSHKQAMYWICNKHTLLFTSNFIRNYLKILKHKV